ncbi:hypothetical protein L2750_14740 [Shewanella submarina]|uniref:Uncharacterized protein n=1 Tax=Shewanella submarina TaxID=2016376 RepID=A0ABV7G592_9GAMM|nr:hypothetical protein [Shewanella submarina]MCL1038388.1 hypothetical protein [Shewanella submarina]
MKKIILLSLLLVSCTDIISDQVIESECFPSFKVTPLDLFPPSPYNQGAFVWLLSGEGNGHDFKMDNGIVGYLMPIKNTMFMKSIGNSHEFTVTGRVLKEWPNWAESHIGGSKRNVNLELSDGKNKYLLMEAYINPELKDNLPERCSFST